MSNNDQYISMMRKTLNAVNVLSQPITYEDKLKQEIEEGRVKDMMIGQQEDAEHMSKAEFIKKHGESNVSIWFKVQKEKAEMGIESAQQGESTMSESKRIDQIAGLEAQLADLKVQERQDAMMDDESFRKAFIEGMSVWAAEADASTLVDVYNKFSNESKVQMEDDQFLLVTKENAQVIADANDQAPEGDEEVVADDMHKKKKKKMEDEVDEITKNQEKLPPQLQKAIKDKEEKEGDVKESRKERISEGISIQTDSLEDQIALMTILKNAGIDPAMMKPQGQPSMDMPTPGMPGQEMPGQEMPGADAPEGPMPDMDQEPEAEAYSNEPDEKFHDPSDYEIKRNTIKNKDMGPSSASAGDNPLPEAKGKKPDYLDFDKDGDKKEPMSKALKDKKDKKVKEDTDELIAELNKQYELMLIGGVQESLGLTASAKVIADETLYDGSRFVVANVIEKGEEGLVAEDGSWEGAQTPYSVAYHIVDGVIAGQIGAGDVPYLSKDGNGTYPLKHKLNSLNLDQPNFFEDQVTAIDSLKAMYEDLGPDMFNSVSTDFGGCEVVRSE